MKQKMPHPDTIVLIYAIWILIVVIPVTLWRIIPHVFLPPFALINSAGFWIFFAWYANKYHNRKESSK